MPNQIKPKMYQKVFSLFALWHICLYLPLAHTTLIDCGGIGNSSETCVCDSMAVAHNLYHHFLPLDPKPSDDNKIAVLLYVQADRDCSIALTQLPYMKRPSHRNYEFLIGAFNNTRTLIRRKNRVLIDLHTPNVLTNSRPLQIQLQLNEDGYIYVYIGNQLLARTFDQAPLGVKYMSFGSFNAANIIYHYNCRSNDVNIKSIKAQ